MWDPATYLRYRDERSRPFFDLTARVAAGAPRAVVDLGCGPGHLTAALATRWPQARVSGLDSSPEMIGKAGTVDPSIEFLVGDVRDWRPAPDVDVVVCNAVLHWVPGHEELLIRWAGSLPAGAWLAMQVPGNFDAPSHRALHAVAREPRWAARLESSLRDAPVRDAAGYAGLLLDAGCAVDAWETTYIHLLAAQSGLDHPVLTWMAGTALRPVRAAFGDDEAGWTAFRTQLAARLGEVYPVRDNLVYFPFRRVFVVAQAGARSVGAS